MLEIKSNKALEMGDLYPSTPLTRLMFKFPMLTWRLGLGPLTGKLFMLITTRGRKSGLPRHTMVEYYRKGKHKYAVSGFGEKSDWYRNIQADPNVTIQTSDGTQAAQAVRITDPDELWDAAQLFMQHDPPLTRWYFKSLGIEFDRDALAANVKRIHLLRFDVREDVTPQGQQVDLAWMWPLALVFLLLLRRTRR